jgi:protein-disulfide isomerase
MMLSRQILNHISGITAMAKRPRKPKKVQEKRGTNWIVIGGVIFVGVLGLFALLFLALRSPEPAAAVTLADYCSENEDRCVELGTDNAPVTMVEVSDFGCPHCKDFHQEKSATIKETYVDAGQVKWVFLPYALRAETVPAANAALCANEQGQYLEFSDALYRLPIEVGLTRDGFVSAAEEIGLAIDQFESCLQDGRYNQTIANNQEAARAARVSGTPTFFVNNQIISGNAPLAEFERLFNQ